MLWGQSPFPLMPLWGKQRLHILSLPTASSGPRMIFWGGSISQRKAPRCCFLAGEAMKTFNPFSMAVVSVRNDLQ